MEPPEPQDRSGDWEQVGERVAEEVSLSVRSSMAGPEVPTRGGMEGGHAAPCAAVHQRIVGKRHS
jgi:hypothetical protein